MHLIQDDNHAPVERDLALTLARNRNRISVAQTTYEATIRSDISYIIVPTPSDFSGGYDVTAARLVCREIGGAIREKSGYHLVVMASTILPGGSRNVLWRELEESSEKRCGADFGLCYSPPFVALGQVISDFLSPSFGLVGESDVRAGDALANLLNAIYLGAVPLKRMALENAELTKVSVNAFITTKIAFANLIADLCERLPHGNARIVTEAIGSDARIGSPCLRPGLGFGGPCFPRDNAALSYFATTLGLKASIAEATDSSNRLRPIHLANRFLTDHLEGNRIAILGLAYKSGSDVLDGSQSVALAIELAKRGATVSVFDCAAMETIRARLPPEIIGAASVRDCLAGAEIAFICLPDLKYIAGVKERAREARLPFCIFDCWDVVGPIDNPLVRLIVLGNAFDELTPGSTPGELPTSAA
jgi:UDPglucose 6-dehydrogenase